MQSQKKKKPAVLLLLAAIIAALIASAIIWGGPLWELFSSQEKIESTVESAGPWGPVVMILLQILQVMAAPVPGQVTSFAAGYLFGTALGTVYTMIGLTIGFTLVFVLARKLGRPFVEYFVDQKTLKKFDYLAESRGVFIFFIIFLLPFFPDDLICYIAGLTKIPIKTLVVVSFLARLPINIVFAVAGEGAADANFTLVVSVFVGTLVISALAWWKRHELEQFAQKFSKPEAPEPKKKH